MMSRNDRRPVSWAQRSGRAQSPPKAAFGRWPLSWRLDWPKGGPSLGLSEWTGLETKGPVCGRGQCGRATGSGLGLGRLRGGCCSPPQHHLLKRLSLPHCIFFPPLSKIKHTQVHGFTSELSILFHWSIFRDFTLPFLPHETIP